MDRTCLFHTALADQPMRLEVADGFTVDGGPGVTTLVGFDADMVGA